MLWATKSVYWLVMTGAQINHSRLINPTPCLVPDQHWRKPAQCDIVFAESSLRYLYIPAGGGKVAWTVAHMHHDIIERLVIISAPHPTSWSENFSLRQAIKCVVPLRTTKLSLQGAITICFNAAG